MYAAPLRLTTIELQPGEKIVGHPAAGDTIRWIMDVGRSGTGTAEQEHLYIKPPRSALSTTMVVTTDRRTYYLELHSFEDTYVAAVRWRYPQDEVAQLEAGAAREETLARSTTATNVNVDAMNFNYRIGVEKGRPRWVPLQVFDDNHPTFIRFPSTMLNRDAPALFVVSSPRSMHHEKNRDSSPRRWRCDCGDSSDAGSRSTHVMTTGSVSSSTFNFSNSGTR